MNQKTYLAAFSLLLLSASSLAGEKFPDLQIEGTIAGSWAELTGWDVGSAGKEATLTLQLRTGINVSVPVDVTAEPLQFPLTFKGSSSTPANLEILRALPSDPMLVRIDLSRKDPSKDTGDFKDITLELNGGGRVIKRSLPDYLLGKIREKSQLTGRTEKANDRKASKPGAPVPPGTGAGAAQGISAN